MNKLVLLTRKLYLATLALAIKIEDRKDRLAIKAYNIEINTIDALQERSAKILASIQAREDEANRKIGDKQRELMANRNELQNLKDGV